MKITFPSRRGISRSGLKSVNPDMLGMVPEVAKLLMRLCVRFPPFFYGLTRREIGGIYASLRNLL